MLHNHRILVAEDEILIAMDIAFAVEQAGGTVIGPAARVSEAVHLLDQHEVTGAILDFNLADGHVIPVAMRLMKQLVPVIFHTGMGLPPEFSAEYPHAKVCMKPTPTARLIEHLQSQLNAP